MSVSLDDKYTAKSGRVYVSGAQALVRLPLEQARRDAAAGHHTAGFVSGYRGSPLGTYDHALWRAERHLAAERIHFQPGVNEDLAATSIWGTQQVPLLEGARYEGVFGIWYGKGPGVDRSSDVLKHANFAGTSPKGGVLALCGDDHGARSSTVAHQSDHALIHCGIPVFNPADIQDYIDLGLMGFALSRHASVWVGLKCITDIVDGSASIAVGDGRIAPVRPDDYEAPPGGLSIRMEVAALAQETRLFEERLRAVRAFVRANVLDGPVFGARGARRLGIVTTGKGVADVIEALARLGLDEAEAERLGLGVFKVAMVWPLEPERIRAFAEASDEILVVEEKRGLIEEQLAHLLYNLPADRRPRLCGKRDLDGAPLVSEVGELEPDAVRHAIARRVEACLPEAELRGRGAAPVSSPGELVSAPVATRPASFCAGCPHNTSTVVPQGSVAFAGIGCHGMASLVPERKTLPGTHMGGEGATWIGQAPFVDLPHVFQNLGDGTYFHSGIMAIRGCVAANVDITYKILLNGAVGMTGGQPIEGQDFAGEITAPRVAHQVAAEGVRRIAVVTDDVGRFAGEERRFPPGTTFHDRDALDRVQRELRETKGVTVLVYDQSCATERRRMQKRGELPAPEERVLIASEVCEGCGDCGLQSNCIAIEPLDTALGRKRTINQSVCNQDMSCLDGTCPSFITVRGGRPRARVGASDGIEALVRTLPDPTPPDAGTDPNLLVTGIGGAGVITVGAILGMAAHLQGVGATVLDNSGFAQRNGSVMSHVRFAAAPGRRTRAARIPKEEADVVIGCDPIVAAGAECLGMARPGAATIVLNRFVAPTNAFALDPDYDVDVATLERRIAARVGADHVLPVDATELSNRLLGNAIGANMMLVGYAWQRGLVPLERAHIEAALRLNGTAVEMNLRAFGLGRALAVDPAPVLALAGDRSEATAAGPTPELGDVIERHARHLTAYQNQALADRYRARVTRVATAEAALGVADGEAPLALAVAHTYAKLLAYKDEYEVARLLSSDTLRREIDEAFEGELTIHYNLAPPTFARRDPRTGRPKKVALGRWMAMPLGILAQLKGLRGTPLDLFGYHPHRRRERALIAEYEALVDELLAELTPDRHAAAVELATIHGGIRGFDLVKDASIDATRAPLAAAWARFRRSGDDQNAFGSR